VRESSDPARSDAVDTDAGRRVVLGEDLHHVALRGFRRIVVRRNLRLRIDAMVDVINTIEPLTPRAFIRSAIARVLMKQPWPAMPFTQRDLSIVPRVSRSRADY
jgi:hypothetical protein